MHDAVLPQERLVVLFDSASVADVGDWLPSDAQLTHWVSATLSQSTPDALDSVESLNNTSVEVSVGCVSSVEMRELNEQYRDKDKSTNVLSFPADMPILPADGEKTINTLILGDIIICPEVLKLEATEQSKTVEHHWAHMVIHSVLHLNGHDHMDEKAAHTMESLEIQILSNLGITNPYLAASAK